MYINALICWHIRWLWNCSLSSFLCLTFIYKYRYILKNICAIFPRKTEKSYINIVSTEHRIKFLFCYFLIIINLPHRYNKTFISWTNKNKIIKQSEYGDIHTYVVYCKQAIFWEPFGLFFPHILSVVITTYCQSIVDSYFSYFCFPASVDVHKKFNCEEKKLFLEPIQTFL